MPAAADEDLFDDGDDELDEHTLAALDLFDAKQQLERNKRAQATVSPNAQPPPTKRQRVEYEQVSRPITSLDQLPEITVHDNGQYAIPAVGSSPLNASSGNDNSPLVEMEPPAQPASIQASTFRASFTSGKPSSSRQQSHRVPSSTIVPQHRASTRPPPPANNFPNEDLQRKLTELQDENAAVQQKLKDATNMRYKTDGEVAILRQKMDKESKDHAQKLAELKAKLDEAATKMAQMQRESKEEREKMQTQFAFKQQEYEAARKQVGVQRSQRPKDAFNTPLRPMTQQNAVAGPSTSISSKTRKSPDKSKSQKLRGFQNAFLDSTPFHAEAKKGKARVTDLSPNFAHDVTNQRSSPPSSPTRHDMNGDVAMLDVFSSEAPQESDIIPPSSPVEEVAPLVQDLDMTVVDIMPLDWNAELHRILLTHTYPGSAVSSLQGFISIPVPEESQSQYRDVVSQLLRDIASNQTRTDHSAAAATVASSLISILSFFVKHDLLLSLITLLNLLCILIYTLPSFSSTLLSRSDGSDESPLLVSLCDLIRQHLHPPKEKEYPVPLATETMNLLDALCWNPRKDDAEKLVYLSRHREVYANLLHGQQPTWMLIRVTKFLALQLSCAQLAQNLLVIPSAESPQPDSRFPVLDRLCSFIVDTNRQGTEAMSLKESILGFIGLLSASHPEAISTLSDSQVLVPSLVDFITSLVTPIWQDDDTVMASALPTTRLLNQTIHLLHRLAYYHEPPLNIRYKLNRAPVRHFNGILHKFTLTFGRLTYGTPPDWMSEELKVEMGVISDLLDLVVDGPDNDAVWLAFQENPEETSKVEDENMEEKLMGYDE
ncbi:hypothetical protein BDZ89DRAFT_1107881 [Hymenopellis radicata]|nr:hypothetical protein BDZ89DRAFT_1107881 [Hymenopellis radicata]